MSILQILAIAGLAAGIIAWIQESRYRGRRSYGVIAALIIASCALLIMSFVASAQKSESKRADGANVQIAAAEPVPAETAPAAQNGEDSDFEIGIPDDSAQDAQPEAAQNSGNAKGDAETLPTPEKAPVAAVAAAEAQAAPAPAEKPAAAVQAADDPLAPSAVAGNDIDDAKVNETIAFTAKKSKKAPNGADIAGYLWDFGDGATSAERDAKHSYANVGTYDAVLTVTAKDGRIAKAVRRIEVNRPEHKIRFERRSLDNAPPADHGDISGTYVKQFAGSSVTLEAKGYMLSAAGCSCSLHVALSGEGCGDSRSKTLKDGGEGELSVKASCKGAPGEIKWSFARKASDGCACTFNDVRLEGSEG